VRLGGQAGRRYRRIPRLHLGTPTHDESALFGALAETILEGGLSWATVFRKRTTLHAAFHHFDPQAVAAITDADIDLLLTNPGIIRNRRKIEAIVHDAQVMRTGPSSPNWPGRACPRIDGRWEAGPTRFEGRRKHGLSAPA
jgi:DNA-3-methyladenine glycosylase I